MPRGGPDGGDGGKGGSITLEATAGLTTLGDLRRHPHLRAKSGGSGSGSRSHGRNGAGVIARVPPGTVIRVAASGSAERGAGEWLGELLVPGQRLVVARGGRGGRGNVHFASATLRAPTHFEKGEPGEERWLELELKLIADVGLVGAPNAGKSTLLAALTAAEPKIGAYPFTTVAPNLGVLQLDDEERTMVLADVPGLIEGASEGHGLGHEFLRHVERTRVLVAVVDGAAEDPVGEWAAVAEELRLHDPALLDRPMPMVVTKQDLPDAAAHWSRVRAALRRAGHRPIAVSAHAGTGLAELRRALRTAIAEAEELALRPTDDEPEVRVHRFDPLDEGWEVVAEGDGLRVRGRRIERSAARTNFTNPESRDRFQRLLERLGIDAELRRHGVAEGSTVRIGPVELEWGDE